VGEYHSVGYSMLLSGSLLKVSSTGWL